jgi:glycerol-3-phosphate dehydrogenase (NAD(P)+)
LSDAELDIARIDVSDDINHVVREADIIILATPSAFLKKTLEPLTESLTDKFIVSAIKGIIPEEYLTVAEYMNHFYDIPFSHIGIVTGPCHAEEVALEHLSYLTVVCTDPDNSEVLRAKFSTKYIRTVSSTDIYGIEYATVLKNIYAIAAGMCQALHYGDNFQAVLLSNAIQEIQRFATAMSNVPRDITASGYLGDVLVTGYSQFSRNRQFGQMLGLGYSVKAAQMEMEMIAEGFYGTKAIYEANQRIKVSLPIVDAMYEILYNRQKAKLIIKSLTTKLQ